MYIYIQYTYRYLNSNKLGLDERQTIRNRTHGLSLCILYLYICTPSERLNRLSWNFCVCVLRLWPTVLIWTRIYIHENFHLYIYMFFGLLYWWSTPWRFSIWVLVLPTFEMLISAWKCAYIGSFELLPSWLWPFRC